MQRLIDANALKLSHCKECSLYPDKCMGDDCDWGAIIHINAMPTIEAEPHWIPVSERLPEVRQWVLCQCRAGIMDILRLTADGSWEKSHPRTDYMSSFVVAWMPLPKQYKGDKE